MHANNDSAPIESAADPDTVAVTFTVQTVEPVRNRGSLIGLATVELDVAGAVFTLQGVQITRTADGLDCRSPVWRHPMSGTWVPGVLLPPELASALGAEVLKGWQEAGGKARRFITP